MTAGQRDAACQVSAAELGCQSSGQSAGCLGDLRNAGTRLDDGFILCPAEEAELPETF